VLRFVTWLMTTAIAVAVAALLFEGIYFNGQVHGTDEISDKLVPLLLVSLILGVVTSFVKPVLTFLSIPLIVITFGLFLVLINAAMLKFTSWLAGKLDIGFHVEGFWPAIGGAIVITVVTWIVDSVIGESR
jgi:putative membrane protein